MHRLLIFAALSASMLFLVPSSCFAESRIYNSRNARCRALGLTDLGEYIKPADVQCFKRIKRAKAKGYISASSGVLSNNLKPEVYEFELSGANAVPPANTTATGSCTTVLNAAEDLLRVVCEHTAATASKAHIHLGSADVVGPKICIASSAASPIAFNCPVDASQVDALHSGELYVNIHSLDHAPGELRNQIQ